jgi:hypothetical protein
MIKTYIIHGTQNELILEHALFMPEKVYSTCSRKCLTKSNILYTTDEWTDGSEDALKAFKELYKCRSYDYMYTIYTHNVPIPVEKESWANNPNVFRELLFGENSLPTNFL